MKDLIISKLREYLNESKTIKLPQYLYHLTSLEKFEKIKKEGGLNPKYSKQSKGEKGIYLTDDIYVAKNYAGFYDLGTKLVLLKIKTNGLDLNEFLPDDYELQEFIDNGGWGMKDKNISKYDDWYDVPWELSLKWVNQVQYHDIIPFDNIEVLKKFVS